MSSRHSGSSRHRSNHARSSTEDNTEDLIEQVKGIITGLNDMISCRPREWQTYLTSARSAVTALERLRFFRDPQRVTEQVWILQGLQDYAFHDSDSGFLLDIAQFTETSWLRVLRNYPDNVETLTGLGRNWLQRAQATLAIIQREEANDSLSSGGGGVGSMPNDPRRQGPMYVEARDYLQPAVDFYARAIRAADSQDLITGDILSSAAEARMSLGNVTASPSDESLFAYAIRYLRRAEALPGYRLSIYMQQYLNDYGRYVS